MIMKQIHYMNLNEEPFNKIKNGKKCIELRLNDEKRKKIKVGDTIIFTNRSTNEILKKEVSKLHYYHDFKELYQNLNPEEMGYSKGEKANHNDMEQYYSKEDIQKYGAVGIELKRE